MKKVGIFAALGCLITVGGVFAQWTYSQGTATTVTSEMGVKMEDAVQTSEKGKITVDTSAVKITIDDGGYYVPKVKVTGDVIITFTANPGADADVAQNGIIMDWSLSIPTGWMYDKDGVDGVDTEIFKLENATEVALNDTGSGNNPCLSATIPATRLEESIKFNVVDSFKLDTFAKYEKFKLELNADDPNHKITLTVKES